MMGKWLDKLKEAAEAEQARQDLDSAQAALRVFRGKGYAFTTDGETVFVKPPLAEHSTFELLMTDIKPALITLLEIERISSKG